MWKYDIWGSWQLKKFWEAFFLPVMFPVMSGFERKLQHVSESTEGAAGQDSRPAALPRLHAVQKHKPSGPNVWRLLTSLFQAISLSGPWHTRRFILHISWIVAHYDYNPKHKMTHPKSEVSGQSCFRIVAFGQWPLNSVIAFACPVISCTLKPRVTISRVFGSLVFRNISLHYVLSLVVWRGPRCYTDVLQTHII